MLEWGRKAGDIRPIRRDGEIVARVRPLQIRDHAGVDVGDAAWSYYSRGDELFGAPAGATEPATRATAVSRGMYAVHTDRAEYRIERFGMPRSPLTIARSGVNIGSSGTVGWWSRRPTLDIDPGTPLEHQVFLLWVAFVMRGRPGVRARRRGTAIGGPVAGTGGTGFGGMAGGVDAGGLG